MHETILDVSKRRGIIYPSFEIYGGVSGFYDYGPVGSALKRNVEDLIRRFYLVEEGCVEVNCPTLSPEDVWVASGHTKSFTDAITECSKCGEPYRADHLIEENTQQSVEGKSMMDLWSIIQEKKITCPKCKSSLQEPYNYNLMFQTYVGPGKYKTTAYLRPETAQTTYLGFKRLWEFARKKLPFGVLQIGHSYRNEISPRQGVIRLREFNQAEIQFLVDPENKKTDKFDSVSEIKVDILTGKGKELETTIGKALEDGVIKIQFVAYQLGRAFQLFTEMGINPARLRLRQHRDDERAFYSSDTWDIEFSSESFGRIELVGIADRTDYDLTAHMKLSKQDMTVNIDGRKFVPHVIEVAYGIDRPIYCILESCLAEEQDRTLFKFPKNTAPYLAGIFPLVKKDGLPEKALEVFKTLKNNRVYIFYDESGSIGKRYARADEIGVPYCITIDYDSLKDNTVTVRERDSKEQSRVKITQLLRHLSLVDNSKEVF